MVFGLVSAPIQSLFVLEQDDNFKIIFLITNLSI